MEKHGEDRKLKSIKNNNRILELIRKKIEPRHKKLNGDSPSQRISPKPVENYSVAPVRQKARFSFFCQRRMRVFQLQQQGHGSYLVEKARRYVKGKKNDAAENLVSREIRPDLVKFMKILGNGQYCENSCDQQIVPVVKQPNKIRNSNQFLPEINIGKITRREDEQMSITNAKIREKFNHKKMISMSRH